MMPELDGFGLLQALKSRPATADLPVVLLSARAGEESRIDGLAAGADDYIVKPFTAQQLVAQVGAQLTIRQARRKIAEERERLVAREQVAKREAQLQRQHLVTLFMNAPNPIMILRGPDYVIDLANRPCCEVWGKRYEEVINRPLYDVLPELRGQGFKELLDGVMHTGEPFVGKETPADLMRADGNMETVYFNFVYTPLRNVEGHVDGVLVSAFNVTDEVVARQQMTALRREAEAANRSKDEFLAMLSHELRNPLAPIATAIQLMRLRGAEVPELGTLERQAAHLTRLVDDLLDVSRLTRGKIELRVGTVEIGDAVLRAMEMAGPLLERRSHLVNIEDVPRRGLAVNGDPERLAQVVFNLLSNAAKYSEPGSRIDLLARREGDRVLLRVKDQGAGIAPDMIHRVFDMFVQQEQTIARSVGGLGLGLTIVRSLVEMHGGRVSVRSPGVGQGSEFTVELPAAVAAARPAEEAADAVLRPAGAPARRILVVDDNVDAGTALGDLLKLMGHEVEVVHDGAQALTQAPRFQPDIALIDIGLPVMDGYALAQRLRCEYPGARQLKLVAVTGYGLERDRELSARAGFSHHLVKPIDPAMLGPLLADEAQRSAARSRFL
jgi:signal transduction histidine kinase/DNA-binding response OmpR family regulator